MMNNFYRIISSFPLKTQALILAVIVFFMAIPYGNAPKEIDMSLKTGVYEFQGEEVFSLSASWENVGRPFLGESHDDEHFSIFRIENGERKYFSFGFDSVITDDESVPRIIETHYKGGFRFFNCSLRGDDIEPGAYSVAVTVYGCEKVFEDALIIG